MPPHFINELLAAFSDHSGRPAVVHRGRSHTYGELAARMWRCAGLLRQLGVGKGDRVALCTGEKLPFLSAFLGSLCAGGIALPLNPKLTRDELRYFLADSGARVVVAGEAQRPLVESLQAELPDLGTVVSDAAAESAANAVPIPAVGGDEPCLMIYSSGTTGWPKGVVHTQGNMASALRALQECWRFTPDDVVVNVLPLFHIHGLAFATLLTLLSGGCVRIEDSFHPVQTLKVVGLGTVFMAVPTIYYRFLEQPEFRAAAASWQRVRLFACGSAPIRAEVLPELEAVLGRPVINRYGMTEAFVITSLPLDGPWPQGSVGLPLGGVDVRVVREDGRPAIADEVGSVQIRGANLFREYWRKPDATRTAFAGGWFDTGDLGRRDAAGFLSLVGRKNDLIITNGYNVYPQVVERVIDECPGVRESVVLGIPDPRRGEQVAAVIVREDPTLNEARLRDYWSRRLVDYQRPLTVMFRDSLPRNAMGKVLRRELKEEMGRAAGQPG